MSFSVSFFQMLNLFIANKQNGVVVGKTLNVFDLSFGLITKDRMSESQL